MAARRQLVEHFGLENLAIRTAVVRRPATRQEPERASLFIVQINHQGMRQRGEDEQDRGSDQRQLGIRFMLR
jgi:hypothetical protein